MVGKTLSHYEILESLGAGGMGEVYRARDTKLDRDVALKFLPEELSADPERLARFEREAKLLASLNHANIAAVYGLEDDGDIRFIAMELVEGETLGDRAAAAGGLGVEESLEIARQIAVALEMAHESGVVHRDLKPANIMLTTGGQVKVLDFGLAKAFEADGSPAAGSDDISNSPTIMGATRTGMIVGTAAYMSPEQAAGAAVDKRTDIWGFGVVLYEMLAGAKLFEGESVAHILADVIRAEPDFERLPDETPAAIRKLLRRCLQKKPEQRLRDIGDARLEIDEVAQAPEAEAATGGNVASQAAASTWRTALPWALAAVATVIAAAFAAGSMQPEPEPIARTLEIVPIGGTLTGGGALSPDGSMIVFWGERSETKWDVMIRDLVTGTDRIVHTVDGNVGAWTRAMRWAWNSESFTMRYGLRGEAEQQTLVVPVSGGSPRVVTREGTIPYWTVDGDLVFNSGSGIDLLSLASGQTSTLIETSADGEPGVLRIIQPLADGSLLYEEHGSTENAIRILHFDGAQSTLVRELPADMARGWSYADGYLLGQGGDGLLVLPYDDASRTAEGSPWALLPGVITAGGAMFSHEGTMIYGVGDIVRGGIDVEWLDRAGNTVATLVTTDDGEQFRGPWLSPDGGKMAVARYGGIWIYDLDNLASPLRLPGEGGHGVAGWMPDGERLVVGRTTEATRAQRTQEVVFSLERADGTGTPMELTRTMMLNVRFFNAAVSPDGRYLIYGGPSFSGNAGEPPSVVTIEADGSVSEPSPFPRTVSSHRVAISPDNQWVAFVDTPERGGSEIWLASFPDVSSPRLIGTGNNPFWSDSGEELYFTSGTTPDRSSVILQVDIDPETGMPAGAPIEAAPLPQEDRFFTVLAASPDGERFLISSSLIPRGEDRRTFLVEDWTRLLPEGMRRR